MKKVLITGSNGLLGQKLLEKLSFQKNIKTIATSINHNRAADTGKYIYESLDVGNKKDLVRILNYYKPDTVIHTAAMTEVDKCEELRDECQRLNIDSVTHIVEATNLINSHLIYLSSDFVFDGTDGPYCEDDLPTPPAFYGYTKAEAEKIIMSKSKKWSIVRTILVYGVVLNMSRSNIVLWVKKSLEEGKPIRVVIDQFRMPTLVDDLAYGCLEIAERKAYGIYHISGNEMKSIYEIAIEVADFFKLDKSLISPVSSNVLGAKAKRPVKTGFILNKAIKDLDYKPTSFMKGLEVIYNS